MPGFLAGACTDMSMMSTSQMGPPAENVQTIQDNSLFGDNQMASYASANEEPQVETPQVQHTQLPNSEGNLQTWSNSIHIMECSNLFKSTIHPTAVWDLATEIGTPDQPSPPPGGQNLRTHTMPPSTSPGPEGSEEECRPAKAPQSLTPESIATVVKEVLQNIFGKKGSFRSQAKPSPRQRKMEDEEVRWQKEIEPRICQNKVHCLFKEVFGITQDTNFIVHQPVPVDNVQAYEHEDGPGPNSDKPAFDLTKNHTSPWNAEVIEVGQSSLVMAILEVKARMLAHLEKLGKESHQATRCHNKYKRRMAVLNYVVQLRMEVSNDDLTAWKWLQCLVKTLGEQGISSKESAVENEIERVLHIKRMEWRCCIDHELDIINVEQVLDDNIFSP
ncbi:hypothetical protein EDD16DRAFT_1520232 [Pisolithus croceorrhizus]|nr:hypothetical protein EDD16DRAFT_1520232 [Pisolithus croceorrhizus]